ncbi:PH domain-containing protein [Halovivax limisalsi]|uniref:PH domain-containing protein n=1 Tax=Halovivax limisalsi TaxID=1453760 RepID=UPI001FFD7F02|nr:PH domain-containing protein [Halovivax limisalsi]
MSVTRESGLDIDVDGRPDVGWTTGIGVYVGIVVATVGGTIATAAGVSFPTVVGSLSTAFTFGLIGGALAARRANALPVRFARDWRWLAAPFVVPAGLALLTGGILRSGVVDTAAITSSLGAVGSGLFALALTNMARTRYARLMAPNEPIAAADFVSATQPRNFAAFGLLVLGLQGILLPAVDYLSFHLSFMGVAFLLMGYWMHESLRPADEPGLASRVPPIRWLSRILPFTKRRSVLGSTFEYDPYSFEPAGTSELRVHEEGLVLRQPLRRRFVPWSDVEDVTLTETELRIERSGIRNLRCHREVIDDAVSVRDAIDSARQRARETVSE